MRKHRVVVVLLAILACSFQVSAKKDKVRVCHFTSDGGAHIIEVSENALAAHLAHGDVPAPASVQSDDDCLIPQPPPEQVTVSSTTDETGVASFIIPDTNIIAEITVRNEASEPISGAELALVAIDQDYLIIAFDPEMRYAPAFADGSLLEATPGSALRLSSRLVMQTFTSTFPGMGLLSSGSISFPDFVRSHFSTTERCFVQHEFETFLNTQCTIGKKIVELVSGQVQFTGRLANQVIEIVADAIDTAIDCDALAAQSGAMTFAGRDQAIRFRMYHPPLLPGVTIFPFYFEELGLCGGACCGVYQGHQCAAVSSQISCDRMQGTFLPDKPCTPSPCPETGACCNRSGICSIVTKSVCDGVHGSYQGDDTLCSPNPCPVPGACCDSNGNCSQVIESVCNSSGGKYQGDGTSCSPNRCPQPGACCDGAGGCAKVTESDCRNRGGTYLGDGTPCNPNPCPPPGACCDGAGNCSVVTELICNGSGGSYQGDWTTCSPNPCPQPGACCDGAGNCTILSRASCVSAGGSYQGDGSMCSPNPCPVSGACCDGAGNCAVVTQASCSAAGGSYHGDGSSCSPSPCPIPGACCDGAGNCAVVTQVSCSSSGGSYQGDGSSCSPNPCPIPGACCDGAGNCSIVTRASCNAAGGSYHGDGSSCSPSPCPIPGACCDTTGGCSVVSQASCSGSYQGDGTTCNPNPCPIVGACCAKAGGCTLGSSSSCSSRGGYYMGDGNPCGTDVCPPFHHTLYSSSSTGGESVRVPVSVGTVKLLVTVPGNMISGSGTTGDCGRGDFRVEWRLCPPNSGCTGGTVYAGQGHGLNICHEHPEVLGPFEVRSNHIEGTYFSFNAVTVKVSTGEVTLDY
jgi:hypothetical protein